jgi:hypothetical protein
MVTMRALAFVTAAAALYVALASAAATPPVRTSRAAAVSFFETADRCQACHNGLITASGSDVSIGVDWRASMMAHSARDPYWHAGVRREVLDHPRAAREIEHECSRCHMPMAHVTQVAAGGTGQVFANLPIGRTGSTYAALAADGVSCTACHQIQSDKLGTPDSFTGHFLVDIRTPPGDRRVFGPFAVEPGLRQLMHSATAFQPTEGAHVRSSELCATCHTLFTHTLDGSGNTIGTLPEQVPYLEWRHSSHRMTRSCQACHMPAVPEPVRVSSTLGTPRDEVSRHTFRGSNFWMLKVLNRYRAELGVPTLPQDLELTAQDTRAHLERESASIRIDRAERHEGRVVVELSVSNRAGHKLPTAYPSRRAWLHVRIADAGGTVVFESGAVLASGAIGGNDNDADASTYERHYSEIARDDQVQIYENIMVDANGAVTTGLLSGLSYVKDNRLLPDGFDKATADQDIAVRGEAAADPDFVAGGDRIRYNVPVTATDTLTVTAELLYQSVGYRWAQNLRARPAAETSRFAAYYDSMSHVTAARLAVAAAAVK